MLTTYLLNSKDKWLWVFNISLPYQSIWFKSWPLTAAFCQCRSWETEVMAQVTNFLPPMLDTHTEFLAPGLGPDVPWLLQTFGGKPVDGNSLCVSLSLFMCFKHIKKLKSKTCQSRIRILCLPLSKQEDRSPWLHFLNTSILIELLWGLNNKGYKTFITHDRQ